jgi:hypothetical protein
MSSDIHLTLLRKNLSINTKQVKLRHLQKPPKNPTPTSRTIHNKTKNISKKIHPTAFLIIVFQVNSKEIREMVGKKKL